MLPQHTGICPAAKLFAARVFTGDRVALWSAISSAIKWALANSVHIICLPLGGPACDYGTYKAVRVTPREPGRPGHTLQTLTLL